MSEDQLLATRSRGRPRVRSDEATRDMIVAAATREFQDNGYAATCMDDVARRAGVSKKTLYRLIPNKAELFRAFVATRIERFMLAIDASAIGGLDVTEGLERIMIAFGVLTLSRETIAINRLVIAECERFPELAATFYKVAITATNEAVAHYLALQCEQGALHLDDPHLAAAMLRSMMIMEPQRAVMLGQRPVPTGAEIAARARACVQIFLNGCLRRDRPCATPTPN